ncbi:hypothetical protein [Aquimarina sp. 2201CG14-23]|uniref:hypothetical protein n=1 Tax=Aquimarina mycalae TaxID=3040073 RepID=UPI002477EEB8|nr:hypothetical protein [Aquimarina sp. 2201CG14-23]MDH7444649.1 hypothetical protein [Aquimarina sp. 2201CG14-23]
MKKVIYTGTFLIGLFFMVGCEKDNINDELSSEEIEIFTVDPDEVERPGDQGGGE